MRSSNPPGMTLDILCRPAGDVDGNDVIGLAEEQVEGATG